MLNNLINFTKHHYSGEYAEGEQYFLDTPLFPKYKIMLEVNADSIFIELSETFGKRMEDCREVCALSFRKPFLKD